MHHLERYCHYAAGVVGVLLTRLFAYFRYATDADVSRADRHRGKRFGRGLQLTNIVKDHPSDLQDGRCFIPLSVAQAVGLSDRDLMQPALPKPIRSVIVRRAAAHLDVALDYCCALPVDPIGVRLFCVQPMMMAIATLERVMLHVDPTPTDRPRITRSQVAEIVDHSRTDSADNDALSRWYRKERARLDRAC